MKRVHWRWAAGFMVGSCLVLGAIVIGLLTWAERASIDVVNERWAEVAPWLLLWRVGLFSLLVVYWRDLTARVARTFDLDPMSAAALRDWRWRAAAGLLIMDLILVEDLVGKLQSALA